MAPLVLVVVLVLETGETRTRTITMAHDGWTPNLTGILLSGAGGGNVADFAKDSGGPPQSLARPEKELPRVRKSLDFNNH